MEPICTRYFNSRSAYVVQHTHTVTVYTCTVSSWCHSTAFAPHKHAVHTYKGNLAAIANGERIALSTIFFTCKHTFSRANCVYPAILMTDDGFCIVASFRYVYFCRFDSNRTHTMCSVHHSVFSSVFTLHSCVLSHFVKSRRIIFNCIIFHMFLQH